MSRIPPASPPLAHLTRRQFVRALGLSAVVSSIGVPRLGHAAEPVKIGTLLDLTGALEAYGKPIQNGAILAAEQLNAAGGPLGRKIELIHRDSQTDPTAGIDAAKKLVELDKVVAIVGALSSGVTIPVATSVTIPSGIVQISPASTSPQLTDLQDNDLLFRTCPSDALQGKVSGRLAKTLGFQTVSTIYVNNPYGSGLSKTFSQTFGEHGGKAAFWLFVSLFAVAFAAVCRLAARRGPFDPLIGAVSALLFVLVADQFTGGHLDPWDHVESAMALSAAGLTGEAARAYAYCANTQRPDGSWRRTPSSLAKSPRSPTSTTATMPLSCWLWPCSTPKAASPKPFATRCDRWRIHQGRRLSQATFSTPSTSSARARRSITAGLQARSILTTMVMW